MIRPSDARPYTHEELAEMRTRLSNSIQQAEHDNPGARPLPPMLEQDARDLLLELTKIAVERLLTSSESFMAGQLLAVYRMAIEARMLGHHGRYYVVSEADVERIAKTDLREFRRGPRSQLDAEMVEKTETDPDA